MMEPQGSKPALAYDDGMFACLRGDDRSANPFPIGSEDEVDWNCGFDDMGGLGDLFDPAVPGIADCAADGSGGGT